MAEVEGGPMIVQGSVRGMTNGEFMSNGPVDIKQELVETVELIEDGTPPEQLCPDLSGGDTHIVEVNNRCNCSVEELLGEPYQAREFSKTLDIIQKGRPTPNIHISLNSNGNPTKRLFNDHYYDRVEWLTGCEALGKLFCWPCLLFDRMPGMWNRTGFEDIFNFHKAFKRHENTQNHIVASMQLVAFVMNHCEGRVREDADERNAVVLANRETLRRVVVAVGSAGGASPAGIDTRYLLRLARRESSPLSLVPDLHLQVLNSLNQSFTEKLADTVMNSPFVSVFLDETSQDRITAVLRYTNLKGELQDTFAGFYDTDDLSNVVSQIYTEYNLNGRVVAVLLGSLSNVETLNKEPKLVLLHSPAHRMSHVIPRALQRLKECSAFFHIMQCFENWLKDTHVEEEIKIRVPNSNISKWRERPVTALHEHREIIQDLVHSLLEKPTFWNPSSYTSALALQHALKDLEFMFMLRVFKELLPVTDALLDMVLSNSPNLKVCSETVDDYLKVLNWKKEKFDEIWESVQEADLDGPEAKKPRHAGSSRLVAYYRSLYETIVDAVVRQVEIRFGSIRHLEFAGLLDMKDGDRNVVSEKYMIMLRSKRDNFESSRLRNELLVAYAQVDFRGLQCEQLLHHLYDTGLSAPLRQVTRLARLILVLPYASRTALEPCLKFFSKIHAFSKQVSTDPAYLPWAFITMENHLINKFNMSDSFLDKVIKRFADAHPHIELTPFKAKTL